MFFFCDFQINFFCSQIRTSQFSGLSKVLINLWQLWSFKDFRLSIKYLNFLISSIPIPFIYLISLKIRTIWNNNIKIIGTMWKKQIMKKSTLKITFIYRNNHSSNSQEIETLHNKSESDKLIIFREWKPSWLQLWFLQFCPKNSKGYFIRGL